MNPADHPADRGPWLDAESTEPATAPTSAEPAKPALAAAPTGSAHTARDGAALTAAAEPLPVDHGAGPQDAEPAIEAAPIEPAPASSFEPPVKPGPDARGLDEPGPVAATADAEQGRAAHAEAPEPGRPGIALPVISRRALLGAGAAIACGAVGAVALSRLFPLPAGADDAPVLASKPAWTFVADTTRCIGCGLCVAACKAENDVPEEAEFARTWIERHLVAADGTVYIDSPEAGINGFPPESEAPGAAAASVVDAFFEPRLCMQCAESPCTVVCPVGATYRTAEGVILVDAERCIGCGYCVVSCPYGARYLVPAGDRAPGGAVGVADKCTWCYHRITVGRVPACVEVCPVGARAFGDRNDPASPIHEVLRGKQTHPLHPEFGTKPVVVYIGSTRDGKEPA